MRRQQRLRVYMQKLNDIVVKHRPSWASRGKCFRRDDLPVIVCVVMTVTSDLLALATDTAILVLQRITLLMGVQEDLCFPVLQNHSIVVANVYLKVQAMSVKNWYAAYLDCSTAFRFPATSLGKRDS